MPHPVSSLESRIAEQKEAIDKFARLHRELIDIKENLSLPEAAERVQTLLDLNAESIEFLKDDLVASLAEARGVRRTVAASMSFAR